MIIILDYFEVIKAHTTNNIVLYIRIHIYLLKIYKIFEALKLRKIILFFNFITSFYLNFTKFFFFILKFDMNFLSDKIKYIYIFVYVYVMCGYVYVYICNESAHKKNHNHSICLLRVCKRIYISLSSYNL